MLLQKPTILFIGTRSPNTRLSEHEPAEESSEVMQRWGFLSTIVMVDKIPSPFTSRST